MYWLEDGGYVFEIATDGQKFVAVNRDPKAVMILRDYISDYEEISADRTPFESKWDAFCQAASDAGITPIDDPAIMAASKQVFHFSDFVFKSCT